MKLPLILLLLQLWVNVNASLSEKECSELPDVPHAHVSEETKKDEYQEADVIHFLCEPGYISDHISKYVCTSEGWLVVRWGVCFFSDNACELEAMHPHLYVAGLPPANETMKSGHKIRFQCSDEYALNGSKEIECLHTGQWNAPFPTCSGSLSLEVRCTVPDLPSNVRISGHAPGEQLMKGQTLTFTCPRRGHFIRGNAMVECLADGQWSHLPPTCGDALGCKNPPHVANGDTEAAVKFQYRNNERVEFLCQNFYVMEGGPYQTCINGDWIGQTRCRKPCTVTEEAMSRNNIQLRHTYSAKMYVSHNDHIEFTCVRTAKRVGTMAMRQQCIDGVMELPTCL